MAEEVINLTILGPREKRAPLVIDATSTLSQLVASIDTLFPEFRLQRIRLLYAGRVLLTEELQLAQTLKQLNIKDGSALHLHVSDAPREIGRRSTSALDLPEGAMRPTAPPAIPADGPRSEAAAQETPEAPSPRLGFDRLRVLGLDDAQISVLRAQFLADVERDMSASIIREEGETEAHRLLRMEDAWMRAQGPWSDFSMNLRPALLARSNPHMATMLQHMSHEERSRLNAAMRGLDGQGGDLEAGGGGSGARNGGSNAEWHEARQRLGLSPTAGPGGGGTAPALPPGLMFYRRPGTNAHGDDDDDDDDWRNGGAPTPSPEGTWASVLGGAAAGCLFGWIMIIWVGQPSFSRKFRFGLVLGVLLNIVWSIAVPVTQRQADKAKAGTGSSSGSGTAGGGGTIPSGGGGSGGGGGTVPFGPPSGGTVIDG